MRPIETPYFVQADLHTHNTFSKKDGSATPEQIAKRLKNLGLMSPALAITNHNTIEGAAEVLEACKRYGLGAIVITGEEIRIKEKNPKDKYGEISGLFLKETIPAQSTIGEVIAAVKNQKGFLVIPHMFEYWRHGIGPEMAEEVIRKSYEAGVPVAVEKFNARAKPANNKKAKEFAKKWDQNHSAPILTTVGSDAHYWREYGNRTLILMRTFIDRDSFIDSLSRSAIWVTDDNTIRSLIYRTLNRVILKARELKEPMRVEI